MTPTMWLWGRGLIGNKFFGFLGQMFQFIELLFSINANKLVKLILNYKEYSPIEHENILDKYGENVRYECLNNKFKRILWNSRFPGFALHLSALVNYTGPNNIFKKMSNKLISKDSGEYYFLIKSLIGEKVLYDIPHYAEEGTILFVN